MRIPIEISARHVHLSKKDKETLFGQGYELKKLKDISQKGQFSCLEELIISTVKSSIENVRIIGPEREQTQVEISRTIAIRLGINPPLRESGHLKGSERVTLIGPKGELELNEGVIITKRHIHATPQEAVEMGLANGQEVSVKVVGERALTFDKVVVRLAESFVWKFHIDADEGNAAGINRENKIGEIIK